MEWYEAAFDSIYPIVYRQRDIKEAQNVVRTFLDVFEGRAPILDLACGDGRYLESLSRMGITAFGLDLSHYLLKACVDKWGFGDRIIQGDMRHLPFLDDSFDVIINMFTSFGYFSLDTDNLLVFREIHRVLSPGGHFLLDYINAEKISSDLLEESVREEDHFSIEEKRRVEQHGKYLVKEVNVTNFQDGKETHITERLRLYTKNELHVMLERLGFTIKAFYGDYARNPFQKGVSERILILSEKNKSS